MMTMQDVRAKFPQYSDMSDDDLAGALHRKFYSDMPFDQFASKIGLAKPQTVAEGKTDRELSWAETGMDALKSTGTGLAKGVMGLAGAVGDAQQMTGDLVGWGAGKLGLSPETQQAASSIASKAAFPGMIAQAPRTGQIQQTVEGVTGPMYEPKTMTGEVMERVGEFAPSGVAGPGGVVRKAAMTAAPAVASEMAGRIPGVEGSQWQPYVEAGAALATGIPLSVGGKAKPLAEMRESAPTLEKVAATADAQYKKLDQAKVIYDPKAYKGAAMKIVSDLRKHGYTPQAGGEVVGLENRVKDLMGKGKIAGWTEIDSILKDAKKIGRSMADETTKARANIIIRHLEGLTKSDKTISLKGMTNAEKNATIDTARDFARREILTKKVDEMKRKMPGYLSGDESASRNQFGAYLRSPDSKGLSPAEQAAFQKVVRREGPLNAAHNAGSRLGQIASSQGGGLLGGLMGSAFGPAGTAAGYLAGNAVGVGTNIAVRKFMDKITEKAVDDAMKTILAGRKAQGIATSEKAKESLRAGVRASLTSEAASRPVREDWLVQDAVGNTYSGK